MDGMFEVRSTRAWPPNAASNAASSRGHLPVLVGRPRPMPSRLATAPKPRPSTSHSSTSTFDYRQNAGRFNQSLSSFDTSNVRNMEDMFHVRSPRALPPSPPPTTPVAMSPALPVHLCRTLHTGLRPPHALIRPCGPHLSHRISRVTEMSNVCFLLWLPCTSHPAPSRLRAAPHPRPYKPCSFDSAESGGLQSAAELRHVQGRKHGRNVPGAFYACSAPQRNLDPLPHPAPSVHAACWPTRSLPRPMPSLASPAPTPKPAFFLTRQDAAAFDQPLSFDTSQVTGMTNMFWVRTLERPCTAGTHSPPILLMQTKHGPSARLCRLRHHPALRVHTARSALDLSALDPAPYECRPLHAFHFCFGRVQGLCPTPASK